MRSKKEIRNRRMDDHLKRFIRSFFFTLLLVIFTVAFTVFIMEIKIEERISQQKYEERKVPIMLELWRDKRKS